MEIQSKQYGYEKDDHLLIVHDPFVEINESDVDADYSDDFYDARYYIDLSSLSSEQYQLLIETIKDVEKNEYDDIHLYFEGQIEELKNFKDTSQSTYNTKIGIIRLNRLLYIIIQISLVKKKEIPLKHFMKPM